ncbi:unnamed protein product [Lactuca saligna]|uniref:Uncharacterized protein n=1 Tax=Lactuca saligna TaxID=75948 RepID=A0AA35V524_LACSI|nr:unnamed protein product [Lactuca saligna]
MVPCFIRSVKEGRQYTDQNEIEYTNLANQRERKGSKNLDAVVHPFEDRKWNKEDSIDREGERRLRCLTTPKGKKIEAAGEEAYEGSGVVSVVWSNRRKRRGRSSGLSLFPVRLPGARKDEVLGATQSVPLEGVWTCCEIGEEKGGLRG